MHPTEKNLFIQAISEIESHYFKERVMAGKQLRQRDLEYLMDLIEERSNIRISLSTMKRLWKGEFSNSPHPGTLDALAALLGFDSWRAYQQSHPPAEEGQSFSSTVSQKQKNPYLLLSLLGIGILLATGYFFLSSAQYIQVPENLQFEADKTVTHGVPNTVIFSYDLKEVIADSFFIQRSWNPRQKSSIDPTNKHFSEIYYFPGFHWAKLIANEQVIRKTRIHIKTDGWFATAKYDRFDARPVYLDNDHLTLDGKMSVTPRNLENSGFNLSHLPIISYYNIREFEDTDYANFSLETRVKFEDIQRLVCPYIDIKVINEVDASWIGLTSKGCVSNLWLKFGEEEILGTQNDLSSLGAEVAEWQDLKVQVVNKQVGIFLNGQLVFRTSFKKDFGKIMGLIFTFTGPGSVDYVRVKDIHGKLKYSDEF